MVEDLSKIAHSAASRRMAKSLFLKSQRVVKRFYDSSFVQIFVGVLILSVPRPPPRRRIKMLLSFSVNLVVLCKPVRCFVAQRSSSGARHSCRGSCQHPATAPSPDVDRSQHRAQPHTASTRQGATESPSAAAAAARGGGRTSWSTRRRRRTWTS